MRYTIKDPPALKKLLVLDTLLGGTTAVLGLLFFHSLTKLLGLSTRFVLTVSAVTMLYALVAFSLATQAAVSIGRLRVLITANWGWAFISLLLLLMHYAGARPLGIVFLVLQVLVVGALAYLENRQVVKDNSLGQ